MSNGTSRSSWEDRQNDQTQKTYDGKTSNTKYEKVIFIQAHPSLEGKASINQIH